MIVTYHNCTAGWAYARLIQLTAYPVLSQVYEPDELHYMRDVRWKGLGTVQACTIDFYWEKHYGKTAGLSKLELPGAD